LLTINPNCIIGYQEHTTIQLASIEHFIFFIPVIDKKNIKWCTLLHRDKVYLFEIVLKLKEDIEKCISVSLRRVAL